MFQIDSDLAKQRPFAEAQTINYQVPEYEERELYRFALTDTTTLLQSFCISPKYGALHKVVEWYRKIPKQKYKSAEELFDWAMQRSIQSPSLDMLQKFLNVEIFEAPSHEQYRRKLIEMGKRPCTRQELGDHLFRHLEACNKAYQEPEFPGLSLQDILECRKFLIRYMREVGEICLLRNPLPNVKGPYARDYIVEDRANATSAV